MTIKELRDRLGQLHFAALYDFCVNHRDELLAALAQADEAQELKQRFAQHLTDHTCEFCEPLREQRDYADQRIAELESQLGAPTCKECLGSGRTDNHVTGEIECFACEGSGIGPRESDHDEELRIAQLESQLKELEGLRAEDRILWKKEIHDLETQQEQLESQLQKAEAFIQSLPQHKDYFASRDKEGQ